MERVGEQPGLEHFNLAQQLLEGIVCDIHVLNGVQNGEPVGESALDLLQRFSELDPGPAQT